jgi:CAAX prenyl protease-like protein
LWISPQLLFGQPARTDGFNPEVFAAQPGWYAFTIAARFLRLVVVVPLVEEIFWRGFLQRYLINERFTSVPFGKYTPLSFWAVAVAFMLVHNPPDWPAALLTGAIYGWVAVHTKSLAACVVAHAVTNLALGIYILQTRQWGFW